MVPNYKLSGGLSNHWHISELLKLLILVRLEKILTYDRYLKRQNQRR